MFRSVCLVLALILVGAGAGCGGDDEAKPAGRKQPRDIKLPRDTWPRDLAFDDEGDMWISESSADAAAHRRPSGRIVHHRLGEATETSVDDLGQGPDGAMWFSGFQVAGRIDRTTGEVTGRQTSSDERVDFGSPEAMTIGPDGAVYYVVGDDGAMRVRRMGSLFEWQDFPIPPKGDSPPGIEVVAGGPGDALWFPMSFGETSEIGRMSTTGEYTSFPLPRGTTPLNAIAAGPDGAVWFSEPERYRLGRMTTDGEVSRFRLRPGQSASDITAGPDGALWFALDRAVGRITTDGRIRTWPMPRAEDLAELAFSPAGTLWITDPPADMVRAFVPDAE